MVSTRLFSLFAVLSSVQHAVAGSASAPVPPNVVDLGYVKYRGNLSNPSTVAYLGVPYAEPPLGSLRFRKPLPINKARVALESGGKIVDVTEYPDFCVQGSTGGGEAGGAGSEDCLKLNIYTPAGTKAGDKLPVLVYIHGGGYTYGNPRNWPFEHWIEQSPNVLIVSVYYRLASIGFLAAPEIPALGLGDLNAGFHDQIQALRWIRLHISAFGGDPARVTINGQSAGGSSIELHLVSRGSRGLFAQAIAQSVYRTPLPTPEQRKPMFEYYAEQAGCGSGSIFRKMACLRKAPVSALARAQDAVRYNFTQPYSAFHPVIDNTLFTEYPTVSILKGNFADVPIIVGATSNETRSFGTNVTADLKAFYPQLTQASLEEYLTVYPLSDFTSEAQRLQVATGESELICARSIIGLAAAGKQNGKAWTYRYNQPVPPASSGAATGHSAENWMMFRGTSTGWNGTTTFQPQRDVDRAFAEELIAYWLSFVRAGDPNAFKLARSPSWPAYDAAGRQRIVLQEPVGNDTTASGSRVEADPELESRRCVFVASKAKEHQA